MFQRDRLSCHYEFFCIDCVIYHILDNKTTGAVTYQVPFAGGKRGPPSRNITVIIHFLNS